jgi:hypothetical protein
MGDFGVRVPPNVPKLPYVNPLEVMMSHMDVKLKHEMPGPVR